MHVYFLEVNGCSVDTTDEVCMMTDLYFLALMQAGDDKEEDRLKNGATETRFTKVYSSVILPRSLAMGDHFTNPIMRTWNIRRLSGQFTLSS